MIARNQLGGRQAGVSVDKRGAGIHLLEHGDGFGGEADMPCLTLTARDARREHQRLRGRFGIVAPA